MIEFGHLSHVGLRRELNEDTYYGDAELGLWLVADGMGGHEFGEVASALARDAVVREVRAGRSLTDAIRRGRDARSIPWKRWHGADTMQVAGEVAMQAQHFRPEAVFVDGGAMGAGVIDRLRQLGVANVHEVYFGGKGGDTEWAAGVRIRTANKRAEIWSSMRAWLEQGAIPDDQRLADDLTGVEYGYNADQQIQLEKKEHMKARGLPSPDDADALACTFAEPVMSRVTPGWLDRNRYRPPDDGERYDYDPPGRYD